MTDTFSPFAAVSGTPVSAASILASNRADSEDEDKKKKDDEAKAKKAKAEEDDEKKKKDDDEKAKSKKAEEDDEEMKKAKKAKAGEDCDKEDDKKGSARQATLVERERIKSILTNPVAMRNTKLAEAFAFHSDDSAEKAIAFLEASAPDRAVNTAAASNVTPIKQATLSERMAIVTATIPIVGAGDSGGRQPTLAEQIVMAGKKRRGEI